jgi:uncharacterized membrane protein HdeD (DUF308 family)
MEGAMTNAMMTPMSLSDSVRANWGWMLALGILFIVGGVFAFAAPFLAGIVVATVVGVVIAIAGIAQIIHAWRMQSWGGFVWQLIIGIVLLIGGISIYLDPVSGVITLTLLAAVMFVVKGIFQIILGFRLRPHDGWGWIVASGVIALIVGVLIYIQWPMSAGYAIGTLAGISLAFTGWSYVAIALAARRLAA